MEFTSSNLYDVYYLICIALTVWYTLFVVWIYRQWSKIPDYNGSSETVRDRKISILIPARNEEESIGETISSIVQNSEPHQNISIYVIDDFSEDATVAAALAQTQNIDLNILSLSDYYAKDNLNSYKKIGLQKGMESAQTEYVIMSDADCVSSPTWVSTVCDYLEHHKVKLVTGPVLIKEENSLLHALQSFDFMGTMAMTAAGIHSGKYHLANGANLCVERKAFFDIGGYGSNKSKASGDDVFLMQKMAQCYPENVAFLKSKKAIVKTEAEHGWINFYNQRLRWATKTTSYNNLYLTALLGMIFLFCITIVLNVILLPFLGVKLSCILAIQLVVKVFVDYMYLGHLASYFDKKKLMKYLVPSSLVHTIYISLIGLAGLFVRKYSWKGRKVE